MKKKKIVGLFAITTLILGTAGASFASDGKNPLRHKPLLGGVGGGGGGNVGGIPKMSSKVTEGGMKHLIKIHNKTRNTGNSEPTRMEKFYNQQIFKDVGYFDM